jgi:predicted ATP-grasp superfamily ATP-dependent carboligase
MLTAASGKAPASAPFGAVVVGGDHQGLGIARSLGRHNVPVCIIDDEHSIGRFSRYVTRSVLVKTIRDQKTAADTVLDLGRKLKLQGWVLYPTRDETVAAFARYRTELADFFRVPTPEWNVVKWVWDKRNTYRLAQELGIPVPRTWYPERLDELDEIHADAPFVIKPAIKEHFFYRTKAKAWRADSTIELKKLFQKAMDQVGPGEVMIQELIPGDGRHQFAYCAFFKDEQALGSMVVRRTRQHPREFGRASTFVETVNLPILEELSLLFLRAIGYYGLVELEYKLDPRNGEYKLLDVNGRTWGYHTLGFSAGVDFPYLLFADQAGNHVEPCRGRVGASWVRLVTDLPAGAMDVLFGSHDLCAYINSLRNCGTEAVFSREDPLPFFAELFLLPYFVVKKYL